MGEEPTRTNWTFVTNHARVLAAIARDPGIRLRDVAVVCQLTERAVQAIVADLEQAAYLTHVRTGRRNRYHISTDTTLRHPAEAGLSVATLLDMLAPSRPGPGDSGSRHGTGQDDAPAQVRFEQSRGPGHPPHRRKDEDGREGVHPSALSAEHRRHSG